MDKNMKMPKIIFFVNGTSPTPEDFKEASMITGHVVFRNARMIGSDDKTEECEGVAGCVPGPYENLPTAEQAILNHKQTLEKLCEKVGDKPAPKVAKAPKAEALTTPKPPVWTPNPSN